jgi:hypothetical protein
MMKNKKIFVVFVVAMAALLLSAGPVLAKGKLMGKFNATRCSFFFMWDYEVKTVPGPDGSEITRYVSTNQYSEWTVMSENRLVAGLFIDWKTDGNLEVSPTGFGPGVYKGQFYLVPEAASGVWEGDWVLVFRSDSTKVFTGEGVGRGGELEGLTIKLFNEVLPGGPTQCIDEGSEPFDGKILKRRGLPKKVWAEDDDDD